MKQNIIVIVLLVTFTISCSKEPEYIAPKPNADTVKTVWKSHPQVRLDKVFCELAYPTADKLYVLSNDYLLTFNAQHELISSKKFTNKGLANYDNCAFLNEQFFGYRKPAEYSKIRIHLTQNPSVFTDIDVKAIDTSAWINGMMLTKLAMNINNELLVPFVVNQQQKLVIYKITIGANQNIMYSKSQIFDIFDNKTYTSGPLFGAIKENFYVSLQEGLYKLKTNGEVTKLNKLILPSFINIQDTVYIWGTENKNFNVGYTYLIPNQNTWQFFATTLPSAGGVGYRFKNIDNKIIMYYSGQIWQWNIDSKTNKYEIKTISTRGLEGQYPHDFFIFRDRVYYASFSGLFYKPLDKFFEYETK